MNFSVITSQFWSLCLNGLSLGLIYVLISLGYTMVYGVLRLINFANSEIFMVGTFATVWVETGLTGHTTNSNPLHGIQLFSTLLFALLVSMLAPGITVSYTHLRAHDRYSISSYLSNPNVPFTRQICQ